MNDVDELILAAATGVRDLEQDELYLVLEHVAGAGFDPNARQRVRGTLAGVEWRGATLKGSDHLSPAERHFLRHAVMRQEWPIGTTLDGYVQSICELILDPTSGVFTNRYYGAWQLGVVRESRDLRGSLGYDWALVQYRVGFGHWVTAFQPQDGLGELSKPQWSNLRWLRRPRRSNEPRST